MEPGSIDYEASPDVQVILRIIRNKIVADEMEANINISKTTYQLKQSLSKPLDIEADKMEIMKGGVQLQDNVKLMECDISTDDILDIIDLTA